MFIDRKKKRVDDLLSKYSAVTPSTGNTSEEEQEERRLAPEISKNTKTKHSKPDRINSLVEKYGGKATPAEVTTPEAVTEDRYQNLDNPHNAYAQALTRQLDPEYNRQVTERNRQETQDKNLFLANIESVLANPFDVAAYPALGLNKLAGNEINTDNPAFDLIKYRQQVQERTAQKIDESIDNDFLKGAANLLYQAGVGSAESMARAGIGALVGDKKVLPLLLAGLQAAGGAAYNTLQKGGTANQALLSGALSGAAEAAAEKLPLDTFFKNASPSSKRSIVKNLLSQFGSEATEEAVTEGVNLLTDYLIMGEKSDAYGKSALDIASQILEAGFVGGISGGISGGVASAIGTAQTAAIGNDIIKSGLTQDVIDYANTYDPKSLVYSNAQDAGQRGSAGNIGRLYTALVESETEKLVQGGYNQEEAYRQAIHNVADNITTYSMIKGESEPIETTDQTEPITAEIYPVDEFALPETREQEETIPQLTDEFTLPQRVQEEETEPRVYDEWSLPPDVIDRIEAQRQAEETAVQETPALQQRETAPEVIRETQPQEAPITEETAPTQSDMSAQARERAIQTVRAYGKMNIPYENVINNSFIAENLSREDALREYEVGLAEYNRASDAVEEAPAAVMEDKKPSGKFAKKSFYIQGPNGLIQTNGFSDGTYYFNKDQYGKWTVTDPETGLAIVRGYASRKAAADAAYDPDMQFKVKTTKAGNRYQAAKKRFENMLAELSGEKKTESPDINAQADDVKPQTKTAEPEADDKPQKVSAKDINESLSKEGEAAHDKLAQAIIDSYLNEGQGFSSARLFEMADVAYGGTQAEGKYSVKDAYDAMELAVNKYLLDYAKDMNVDTYDEAVENVQLMREILDMLPSQTKRTDEQLSFQQFSTPPNIAYLAAWAANIDNEDVVLEPSAGIGGLAVFPKAWGAQVVVNELSERRLKVLESMGFDRVFNENAEHINDILPDDVQPSVVIMNPPFSSTAGRTATNNTANAKMHIEQAFDRLPEGGRLVAILGNGMSDDAKAFSGWWDDMRKRADIKANIRINGKNYTKYGTSYDIQLVVMDKTSKGQKDKKTTKTGSYTDLEKVAKVLEGIRDERKAVVRSDRTSDNAVRRRGNQHERTGGELGVGSDTAGRAVLPGNSSAAVDNAGKDGGLRQPSGTAGSVERSGESLGENRTERVSGVSDSGDSGVYGQSSNQSESDIGRGLADQSGGVSPVLDKTPQKKKAVKNDDGVFAEYVPAKLPIKGAKAHPAPLVESAAMAAVAAPNATYKPNLPNEVISKGLLSAAQLENIVYAGQAHEQFLPDGERKGYFIGDGTGVGKGRQISGVILDNFRQGREKAVWISVNDKLFPDAQRDWSDLGQNKDDIFLLGKTKLGKNVEQKKGIMFTTYGTLRSGKGTETRVDQIVKWLGKDFDGVIAFDEAHNMGNLLGSKGARGQTKGTATAKAGVELQKLLPKARIVYVSATGATEVSNLAYAQRLGLWGKGTAFTDVNDFVSKIGSSGLAAMELVARDMKAMGSYLARSISYNDVSYDTLTHTMNPMQREIYNTMSKAWQVTLQDVNSALGITNGNLNTNARTAAMSNYYSTMQRFYNQVLTSMSMPSVIEDIKKQLADGKSCVLQIVNTNEAETDRQLAEIKESGGDLEELDLTPRGTLLGYVEKSFPINSYEEYTDENGKKQSRLVKDKNGNPVINKRALAMRDELMASINEMSIPDGPLEMLFDAFGSENVAEITGRSRRVVRKADKNGNIVRMEEKLSANQKAADVQAFQDGKKRILVFSDAGGTGKSYHADKRAKNQQQRIHYLIQPGWNASKAVQGFGRTHRSNQANAPKFVLVTTDAKGQKRFVSTIARRLDQLGALTKGQRDSGSGIFSDRDNLETPLAADTLRNFYDNLGKGKIESLPNGLQIIERMGMKKYFADQYGNFKISDENVARDIGKFLNRILVLEIDEQNLLFDEFYTMYESAYDTAVQQGTLDLGMENVKADKIEIIDDNVIRTDESSGAQTSYVQAKTYTKTKLLKTLGDVAGYKNNFEGLYRLEDGSVRAVYRMADTTNTWGKVVKTYRMQQPAIGHFGRYNEETLKNKAKKIDKKDWAKAWSEEVKNAPEYDERTIHMLTGALLPIWNRLPQEGNTRAMRITAEDGSQYLGRVISDRDIDYVLRNLGAKGGRTKENFTADNVIDRVMKGEKAVLMSDRQVIKRSRVSNEYRLEVTGLNLFYLPRMYPGIITETINYERRFFIPTGENGKKIVEQLIKQNPVVSIAKQGDELAMMKQSAKLQPHPEQWKADRVGAERDIRSVSSLLKKIEHDFKVNITEGHVRGSGTRGFYNLRTKGVRTKETNDLPAAIHELGHKLDDDYGLIEGLDMATRSELVNNLSAEMKAGYEERELPSEGLAEFVRVYMQSTEIAQRQYPLFYSVFESRLPQNVLKLVLETADEVNAIYAKQAESAESSIHLMGDKGEDFRSFGERIKDISTKFIMNWEDSNIGIKLFDDAFGSDTYIKANNSAYSDSVAAQILDGDLTDMNGQYIAPGLKKALKGVNLNDEKEYAAFGEYLIVKHGQERLKEGLDVFANPIQNTQKWMANRQAQLEEQYPDFEEASENLYEYWNAFLTMWDVGSGLNSLNTLLDWNKRWKYYVPFNRYFDDNSGTGGVKKGFANQSDPNSKRAIGSKREFMHPIDNIIVRTVNTVNAAKLNDVARAIADIADRNENTAAFLEKVPTLMKRTVTDISSVKEQLQEGILESEMSESDKDIAANIINDHEDLLEQFRPKKKGYGDVITVMRNGKPEFYKVNDPYLLQSLTNMGKDRTEGILDAYGRTTRFISGNITGRNLVWSIFSNAPRDFMTLYTYSVSKNPFKLMGGVAQGYVNKLKGANADPLYKEFLAMGMGGTSAYTADKNLSKDIRKKWSKRLPSWYNPLEWTEYIADTIEAGPRFAEYKAARQRGMSPQEAMYLSSNVTTNFRRSGLKGKEVNKIIPFFNASVQGLSHFRQFITAEDAPKNIRKKVMVGRMTAYVTASAAIAALVTAINSRDEEAKENYAQLSNYTKNSFWCIPLGDGQYFAIPKPRELAVLSSFFETSAELFLNDNENAFDEFYSYAADLMLPPMVADIAQADLNGMLGNFGLFGTLAHMMANKDFLGRPIVSSSLENNEPKDQYNERTSQIAYWIGQAFNLSPQMIDYFFQNTLGGYWKLNTALFPVGSEERDVTLGVANTYVKDNQYSTDIINRMYDWRDKFNSARKSGNATLNDEVKYKFANNNCSFYSNYYKLAKAEPENDKNRAARQAVLNMASEFNKYAKNGAVEPTLKKLEAFADKTDSTEMLPTVMQTGIKDDKGNKHELTAAQYVEFQSEYNTLYWEYVSIALNQNASLPGVLAARAQAMQEAKANALLRLGVKTDDYQSMQEAKATGMDSYDIIGYEIEKADAKADDGTRTKDETLDIIENMNVGDDAKAYLYDREGYSEYGNPYIDADQLIEVIYGKVQEGKSESSIKSGITGAYKDMVIDAYEEGDAGRIKEIAEILTALPLYDKDGDSYYTADKIADWLADHIEKQN